MEETGFSSQQSGQATIVEAVCVNTIDMVCCSGKVFLWKVFSSSFPVIPVVNHTQLAQPVRLRTILQ
jgi:hypothetical protein